MASKYPFINYDPTQNNGFVETYNGIMQNQESNGSSQQDNSVQISIKNPVGSISGSTLSNIDTSFKTIYNNLFAFRKLYIGSETDGSGEGETSERLFRYLDQPGHYYFKLFFYFDNPYCDSENSLSANLLGTKYRDELSGGNNSSSTNTALNYLFNNMEYTRFNYLVEFIQLLSDISTRSPWYFQSVSGLDQAIERQEVGSDFKLDEERKSITIKCLPDAYDNRIGRLLDLYRSIVWSQNLHKWILPSNLRKFDMGIYIFNSPIKTISGGRLGISGNNAERIIETTFQQYEGNDGDSGSTYEKAYSRQKYIPTSDITQTGSKYIELRGCEIDYNSSKTVYSELDNAEGNSMNYEIIIHYDSAAEDRDDPIFKTSIGDFIIEDLMNGQHTKNLVTDAYSGVNQLNNYTNGVVGNNFGAESTILSDLIGMSVGYANTVFSKILLGNIYGFSLSDIGKINGMVRGEMEELLRSGSTGGTVNNATLIYKRITDFTDPEKGTRKLSNTRLYDMTDDSRASFLDRIRRRGSVSIAGKNIYGWQVSQDGNGENETGGISTNTIKNFYISKENHQDIDYSLDGKTLRSEGTDHQDIDYSLDGVNIYYP